MHGLIRRFDAWLSRLYGIFTFSDTPDCIIRLQLGKAPHLIRFPDRWVLAGEPVIILHFWNEHLPPLPQNGPDLAWAARMGRLFVRSLHGAAEHIRSDPRFAATRAVGGVTILLSSPEQPGGNPLMERLGFAVLPYHNRLGRFGEFWENFYTWWLMWTYNPVSLHHRSMYHLHRVEIWMSKEEFLNRYGQNDLSKE